MLITCILCGLSRENHHLAANHFFTPPSHRTVTPTRIDTTPPKESTVDNVTTLPWRVKIGGQTVAAVENGEQAIAVGKFLSNDLADLTISFETEQV